MNRQLIFVSLIAALGASSAVAQTAQPGTIRGRVVEARSGRPLSPAQVTIPGSGTGAVSDASGAYVMLNVPAGTHRVLARMIGFATAERAVTVAEGAVAQTDFELTFAAIPLDEIVVTGTAAPITRRELGNAIATINAADVLEKAVNTNLAELLQARAPGVTILQSTGTPGTAANIRVRGVTSLTGLSEPLVYVDGVRIHSGAGGSFRVNWQATNENQRGPGGGQTASALDALNPEDFESIEVIKGPAAATLYGAEAANGVIQIITKKGRAGDQKLRWNAKFQFGDTDWGVDRRTNFTTCDAVRLGLPAEWPGCQGRAAGAVIGESFLGQALREGGMRNASLSVSGGGRGYSYYAALDDDREEGVFSNSVDKRTSARTNFAFYPSERVSLSVNLAYARTKVAFPSTDNGTNVLEAAWMYQPGRIPQPGQERYGFAGSAPERYEQYDNRLEGDRLVLGTTVNYRPFSWFRNRLTVGGDVTSRQSIKYVPPGGIFTPTDGQANQGAPRNNVYSLDYAGTVEHRLRADLTGNFTFGTQYVFSEFRNTVAQGTGLPLTVVKNVGSANRRYAWDDQQSVKTLGLFAQEQVGWRDRLYLTAAARVDNSSVFGNNIDWLVYPKLSAAYMISEEDFLRDRYPWLDHLKLRLAWGQAGNAPRAFAKDTTYGPWQTVDPVTGQVVTAVRLLTIGNPDVKPERGSEIEAGFEAALVGNRLGVEFTYYNKTMRNAIVAVPLAPSASGGQQFRNVGEINNRGIELSVSATPIRSPRLVWDTRLGLYTNRNELVEFGYEADTLILQLTTPNQRHVEGFPLAGYWVHDPVWNPAENKYVGGPARYVGPSLPTREVSLGNTFTILGRLTVYALLDYKGGHYLLNQTDWRRCQAGVCGDVNDPGVPAERKAMLQAPLEANDALYTQRADFIKVRDVSLTYDLPTAWARRARADRIAITLAGHNLGFLSKPHYTGPDPEVTFNGVNEPDVPGDGQTFGWIRSDLWTVPMLRRFTMSVNVSF